ncbi:hypothetical protein [Flavobacterium koreense]
MKIRIIILLIVSFGFISCEKSKPKKEFKTELDSLKYNNYKKLIELGGTFNSFVVINVKDLNTNEVKEICTKNNFLIGALNLELKNKKADEVLLNKNRYFEFKDTIALNNIGFKSYNLTEFKKFENEKNIDSLFSRIQKKLPLSLNIKTDKEMIFYAHSLFNKGIMSGEYSCFGVFQIINDKWFEERNNRIKKNK